MQHVRNHLASVIEKWGRCISREIISKVEELGDAKELW